MAILNLNDFIDNDEDTIELNGELFHLDLSLKAMVKFQKWSIDNSNDEQFLENASEDLLKIIVKNGERLIQLLSAYSAKSQIVILQKIIKLWNNNMSIENEKSEGDNSLKK